MTVNGTSVTLYDDDSTHLTLTPSPASVAEGDAATTVTVTAKTDGDTFPDDRTVTVKIGKAGDSATSGTDYAAVTAFDITITAGQTSGSDTFTLTPTDDNVIEGEESLSVLGTSPGLQVFDTSVAISEKSTISVPDVSLSASPSSVSEGAGATTVTVTATFSNSKVTFTVDQTVTVSVGDVADSAEKNTDYTAVKDGFAITNTSRPARAAARRPSP